jgi:hypothetical protein
MGTDRGGGARRNRLTDQCLESRARTWKTPHGFQNTDKSGKTAGGGGEFAKQVMAWPTPDLTDVHRGGRGTSVERIRRRIQDGRQISTEQAAVIWQTPATDSFRSRGGDRKDEQGLDQQARGWPTPNAHLAPRGKNFTKSDGHSKPHDLTTAADQLCEAVSQFSLPARRTSKHGPGCSCSARMLNPRFVELLMNLPAGFTDAGSPLASRDYELWEMASCLLLRRMHTPLSIAA